MGSASLLKLVGSIMIAGMVFFNIQRMTSHMNSDTTERVLDSLTTHSASSVIQLLEFDLNRLGLNVMRQENAIISAQDNLISFYTDFDENGVVDQVTYFTSETDAASNTENPNDRILYRVVNSEPLSDPALGVTKFNLKYYDWLGYLTSDLTAIKTIEVELEFQSLASIDDYYSNFRWYSRISPPNIRRY